MSGKRLGSFRSGDRSEYLAKYALSRIAFVTDIPRQEDFGVIDFLCVLAKEDSGFVFPQNAFYAQVKSNVSEVILSPEESRWVSFHMDLPLLICNVDKREGRVSLYGTSNLWQAVFLTPEAGEIVLRLDTSLPLEYPLDEQIDSRTRKIVPLGPPIASAVLDEIEGGSWRIQDTLHEWLSLDQLNIARRSIGRIFMSAFETWEVNQPPSKTGSRQRHGYFMGPYYANAERELARILTGLAHNYRHAKRKEKLSGLVSLLKQMHEYLDDHGKDFAEGRNVVD